MTETIIQAIANSLKELFPKFNIYDEGIEQGYEEPCFFIEWDSGEKQKMVGGRSKMTPNFRVIYLQALDEKDSNNKIYAVQSILEQNFEILQNDNCFFRATNMQFEKQNKDLHFTFEVVHYTREKINGVKMEKVEEVGISKK